LSLIPSLEFVSAVPESNLLYVGHYDIRLVAVSILIAVFASYAALDLAGRIRAADGKWRTSLWLLVGALCMGGGTWAMHFIGMLALSLPCSVRYDPWLTAWSMAPGVIASAVALWLLSRTRVSQAQLLGGSVLLGAGIGAMHYSGMAALHIDGMVRYDPALFALSIVVAVALAYVALAIRFRLHRGRWRHVVASVVMGFAVSGMHYTAMAAAYFISDGGEVSPNAIHPEFVAASVVLVTVTLIGVALLAAMLNRQAMLVAQIRSSEHQLRRVLDTTQEGFWVIDSSGITVEVNAAMCMLLGHRPEELMGRPPDEFTDAPNAEILRSEMRRLQAREKRAFKASLLRADGLMVPCHFSAAPMIDATGESTGSFALVTDISSEQKYLDYQRQAVAVFEQTAEGIMITDTAGIIQSVNHAFTEITGYAEAAAIGQSASLLKSGQHDPAFYQAMWQQILSNGSWKGEIWNLRANGETYPELLTISAVRDTSENGSGQVISYIGVFSDISHIKRSQDELRKLAHFDALTGLANRALLGVQLSHALDRAERESTSLAVVMLDLDGFKDVNDSLGHPVGDMLLKTVATRLTNALRTADTIARLGGDEFAIILESFGGAEDVAAVADKLIGAIAEPYQLGAQAARVTTSIGISLFPADGDDEVALMRAADTALYAAKREGRNTYRFHDSGMAEAVKLRVAIEQGLRHALNHGGFEVWYQPKLDLRTKSVIGAEALVRWRHPKRGLVSPGEFIPVAEDTGLIVPLGEWVLREACRQTMDWVAEGIDIGSIAVNVDGAQIERSNIIETVERVLAETGIPAHRLELEITESLLLNNAERGMGTVAILHEMGVGVAIDDFGTGYSSLSYLKYLRADRLKIDRSFVIDLPSDPDDATIARTVINLGKNLGFSVIAEGVETEAQEQFLFDEGCYEVQGYRYAKPMPAVEFAQWFRSRKST
jgi:diguanylate cyclase (GGDEF)-like protein/PAS domain S-box-containing protein